MNSCESSLRQSNSSNRIVKYLNEVKIKIGLMYSYYWELPIALQRNENYYLFGRLRKFFVYKKGLVRCLLLTHILVYPGL